jgi:hypothetical protein
MSYLLLLIRLGLRVLRMWEVYIKLKNIPASFAFHHKILTPELQLEFLNIFNQKSRILANNSSTK